MLSQHQFFSSKFVNLKRYFSSSVSKSLAISSCRSQINNNVEKTRNPIHQIAANSQSTHYFISNALKLSAKMGCFNQGKQLHSHVVKLGYYSLLSMQNQILSVYVRCREFAYVQTLFDEITQRNVVTWNILICGVIDYGGCNISTRISNCYVGFRYLTKMLMEKVTPDYLTLNGLIRGCAEINDVNIGGQLHGLVIKWGWFSNCFVGGALVDLYAKARLVCDAKRVFDDVLSKDLVLWNVMINSFSFNFMTKEAFGVYGLMQMEGVKGDEFTFSSLLSSCGICKYCDTIKQIHSVIIRLSFDSDLLLASSLVDMYAKNGNIDDARKVFNGMVIRNIVSWTTMIVGYGQKGDGKEAMKLLRDMFREKYSPDELTLASICSSCGHLSSIYELMQIHAYVVRSGFQSFISIANALINAYSKSGRLVSAVQCFSSICKPDLVSWSSLLHAYAFHGLSRESIDVFEKILSSGVTPDHIAFLSVLSACTHGGLVREGLFFFDLMINHYNILPNPEHYTCLIDLLGRAGFLYEAFNVLKSMPFEPGPDVLVAFIGSSKIHGNVGFGKWASEELFKLEPRKLVNYALMSNCFASVGEWLDVARVRKMMKEACDHKKVPGCSWIEIGGAVHMFISSDRSHIESKNVHAMLEVLVSGVMVDESDI